MPRPTVVNAKRQPVPPLNIEELKFWLRIMEEHALFIGAGLPCDNPGLISEAEIFQQQFAALSAQAEGISSERRFIELVTETQSVVDDFYRFIRRLVHLAITCQVLGCNFALFLDHMSREAEYLLNLLDMLAIGQAPLYQVSSARQAVFWLRLMADHAEFIIHRLDPSERNFIGAATEFADEFDELYLQGRDFVSMLRGEGEEVPAYRRFLQDARAAVARFRDFKKAAEALLSECRLTGLLTAVLADHMRREADHFLLVLAILEKAPYVPFVEDGDLEYVQMKENAAAASQAEAAEDEEDEEDSEPAAPPMREPGMLELETILPQLEHDTFLTEPIVAKKILPLEEAIITPDPVMAKKILPLEEQIISPDPMEPAKYKWSGKWPRPLGKSLTK